MSYKKDAILPPGISIEELSVIEYAEKELNNLTFVVGRGYLSESETPYLLQREGGKV